ncbi:hypothetical protein ACJDU8_01935 [Clostridium sp. WILCCON 0269]|uniref:Uncharacterized protein n=1 Tax=Candidatus Clostridium eludens TaxID=3381663 RepID=A0ABW8SHK0_9CLOT
MFASDGVIAYVSGSALILKVSLSGVILYNLTLGYAMSFDSVYYNKDLNLLSSLVYSYNGTAYNNVAKIWDSINITA